VKNTPLIVILNQELVREKLRQKKYDDVCLSSWGHLDEFVQFITSFYSSPERFQGIAAFSFAHKNNGPGAKVKNDRKIIVTLTN